MSTKMDYSADEWSAVLAAPYLAAMLVVVSDINLGAFSEIAALTQAITGTITGSKDDLLKAIATESVSREQQDAIKARLQALKQEKDAAALVETMQTEVVHAADTVSGKSEEDGDAFRKWLMYLAEQTAQASKEGGFLGMHAVRVSEKETAMLERLRQALGVPAS